VYLNGRSIPRALHASRAAFTPDGRRMAFESSRAAAGIPGYRDIFRIRADGTDMFNLTYTSTIDTAPSWQPN